MCLWAEFVCEARKSFQRRFLETIFSLRGDTLKVYRSKGLSSIALKFANFSFPDIFSSRAIFVRSLHIILILFRKCSVTFH